MNRDQQLLEKAYTRIYEEVVKRDRCLRKANKVYGKKTSTYKSGAVKRTKLNESQEKLNESVSREESASPWSIEITTDPKRSKAYNQLGELIIQLSSLRSKL